MLVFFLGFALIVGFGGKAEVDKHQSCRKIDFKNEFCKNNKKLESLKDFRFQK